MPDDLAYARKLAGQHGLTLHEVEIAPDVADLLPRMVDVLRTSGSRELTVVVEEPGLSDILGGTVPTASGYRTLNDFSCRIV